VGVCVAMVCGRIISAGSGQCELRINTHDVERRMMQRDE